MKKIIFIIITFIVITSLNSMEISPIIIIRTELLEILKDLLNETQILNGRIKFLTKREKKLR